MSDDVYACSICGAARYGGHANDAQPLKDGRCCDACYANYVMPARLEELRAAEHERRWRKFWARMVCGATEAVAVALKNTAPALTRNA
jgi:hypothetical protein